MDETSYLVGVSVLEARDLQGKDGNTCNPFVQITCGDLHPQVTFKNEKTNSAVWNQSFTFPDLKMNK